MADERAEAREHRVIRAELRRHEHGERPLQRIENESRGGELLVAGAQHVRRADVVRAHRARIDSAEQFRQHEPERNRTQKVSEAERGEIGGQVWKHCGRKLRP